MLSSTSAISEQPWLLFGGPCTMNQLKRSLKLLMEPTLVTRRSVLKSFHIPYCHFDDIPLALINVVLDVIFLLEH